MTNVADKGEDFGYICVDNECLELIGFSSYIKPKVKKFKHLGNGWRNWWGWKKRDDSEYILRWIFQEIVAKDIFKGITIGTGFLYHQCHYIYFYLQHLTIEK